jgi:hypothetical protein
MIDGDLKTRVWMMFPRDAAGMTALGRIRLRYLALLAGSLLIMRVACFLAGWQVASCGTRRPRSTQLQVLCAPQCMQCLLLVH